MHAFIKHDSLAHIHNLQPPRSLQLFTNASLFEQSRDTTYETAHFVKQCGCRHFSSVVKQTIFQARSDWQTKQGTV